MKSLKQRFEEKFFISEFGCWVWKAKNKNGGYGVIHIGSRVTGRWHYAHRISWQIYRGDINGMDVLHKCDNPSCVNPDHLFLGTQADNNLDRDRKGRHIALRGSKNGMSRLNDEKVLLIRKSTLSSISLSKKILIDPSTIRKIRRRELWGHVNDG